MEIAINYFKNKGHEDIKVVVPRYRLSQNDDRELMKRLQDEKYLVLTPSRIIRGRRVTSYDDRYIIDLAVENRYSSTLNQFMTLLYTKWHFDNYTAYYIAKKP